MDDPKLIEIKTNIWKSTTLVELQNHTKQLQKHIEVLLGKSLLEKSSFKLNQVNPADKRHLFNNHFC